MISPSFPSLRTVEFAILAGLLPQFTVAQGAAPGQPVVPPGQVLPMTPAAAVPPVSDQDPVAGAGGAVSPAPPPRSAARPPVVNRGALVQGR